MLTFIKGGPSGWTRGHLHPGHEARKPADHTGADIAHPYSFYRQTTGLWQGEEATHVDVFAPLAHRSR